VQLQATSTGHRAASKFILIEVVQLDTTIEGVLPGTITYGKTTTLNFSYHLDLNSSRIRGAGITLEGEFIDWIQYRELSTGQYAIEITPLGLGYHEILLVFEKYGFESRSFGLAFTVAPVTMEVVLLDGFSGVEGSSQNLRIRVQEVGTGIPVSGALVTYRLLNSEGATVEIALMNETAETGIYQTEIVMPRSDETFTVQISVELDNYELSEEALGVLQSDTNLTLLLVRTVNENLIWIMGGVFLVAAVGGQKLLARKRKMENHKALAVKRRFDDARNIIGVIVLHKESGIPLYSRILRAGIDESIIAAFITAIRNFRLEFDIKNGSEDDAILPISDIIRVVTTESLVIAFITLNRPSIEQRRKMIAFSRKIGSVFDDEFRTTPMQVLDPATKQSIDTLFEEALDGILLRNYTIKTEEDGLKPDDCIEAKITGIGSVFSLDMLAGAIVECGFEELRAYSMIMDAIDRGVLSVSEQEVTTNEEQFIADVEALLAARKAQKEKDDSAEEGSEEK
jgi:hypothetical protein